MMRRRASPSARTTRIAPTAPCVPVARSRRSCASLGPTGSGASHRETAPARAWKVDRSVAQGRRRHPRCRRGTDRRDGGARRLAVVAARLLALAALRGLHRDPDVDRYYDHFVWQAAAFLEGQAAIRYPVATSDGGLGQRVLPGRAADRDERRRPPRPPAVPAAAGARPRCRSSRSGGSSPTTRRSSRSSPPSTSRSAGGCSAGCAVAAWSASATTVFFAFGTVFWYTAQVGDDLVPGPHRGRRADAAGDRARRRRRPGRARTTSRTRRGRRPRPSTRRRRRPGAAASRSTPASSWPASCSGWPAPPASRSSSALRSSARRRPAGHWWRRSWSAALGAVDPGRGPARLQHRHDRPRRSTRPTTTSTSSRRAATRPSATTRRGRSRIRATSRRTSGSCSCRRPTSCPTALPTPSADRPSRSARAGGAQRGLFDVDCPLAVPRDIGMSVLLTSPAFCWRSPPSGASAAAGWSPARPRGRSLIVARQPDALQPGLGPVRLPVQQRRRRRSRCSSWRSGSSASRPVDHAGHGRCRSVPRSSCCRSRSTVGRGLGAAARDGEPPERSRALGCRRSLVGVAAFVAARWAMLPGLGFWDTAELQTVAPMLGTAHPTGFPTYVLLGWLAQSSCSRSASPRSG